MGAEHSISIIIVLTWDGADRDIDAESDGSASIFFPFSAMDDILTVFCTPLGDGDDQVAFISLLNIQKSLPVLKLELYPSVIGIFFC